MPTTNVPNEKLTADAFADGAIWAGIVAAGIGCAVFGGLVDASEASKSISNALNFYAPTGDLSGKTAVAVAIWLAVWATLHGMWRNRDIRARWSVLIATLILVGIGFVAVFPPFVELFAAR